MLAISGHKKIFQAAHTISNGDRQDEAEYLASWAKTELGLTSDCDMTSINYDKSSHPGKILYSEVNDKANDLNECCGIFQQHKCSAYCLHKRRQYSKNEDSESCKRCVCRSGAGIKVTPDKGDTPGFPLATQPTIQKDLCGYWKLLMPRTN